MKKVTVLGQCVHFGDARQLEGVGDESVDLVVTSPPYWNLKDYGNHASEIGESDYETYLDDLMTVFHSCYRVVRNGGVLVVNINKRRNKGKYIPIPFDIVARIKEWTFWDHNIWYIPNALPQPNAYRERILDNKFEDILVFVKGDHRSFTFNKIRVPQKYATKDRRIGNKNPIGRCLGNLLRIPAYRPPTIKQQGYHVAAFPDELVAAYVTMFTNEGDTVLDPFVGSGTTLKVCRGTGRKGIGYELHNEYENLIRSRIGEPWKVSDWTAIDLIHSATPVPTSQRERRRPTNDVQVDRSKHPLFADWIKER